MCAPQVIEAVQKRINRRTFLKGASAATAAYCVSNVASRAQSGSSNLADHIGFSRVVDLSHTLHKDFPAWFVEGEELTTRGGRHFIPPAIVNVEPVFEWEHDRVNLNKITYWEHVGTHMDAPLHFSQGSSADEIPVEDLVLPLAVIDIKAKASQDPLAQLSLEDLLGWEAEHGEIPARSLVAMNSGWADLLNTPRFKSLDENGKHRQPALHVEAVQFLMEERDVIALGVDTFSFDNQHSHGSDVHYEWLGDGRWGLEILNNLDNVPPVGATVIVGQPKIKGSTGGPDRILALV